MLPRIFLARHGQTEWSKSGQHTGLTDIALTEQGEMEAKKLGKRLQEFQYSAVFSSPLQRAFRTAQLAGYMQRIDVASELAEWHYGEYEGLTSEQIRGKNPEWLLFRDGCPGGESPEEVTSRIDGFVGQLRKLEGDILCFAHGHILRVVAARWLNLPIINASHFLLSTASLSILGYEHNLSEPAIRLWNDIGHLQTNNS